jgi:cytochrome b involved in lipid metabolism
LVVCDGFVVNIRKLMGIHPGGAKVLEKAIGTDITNGNNFINCKDYTSQSIYLFIFFF